MNIQRGIHLLIRLTVGFVYFAGCAELPYERTPSINRYLPPSISQPSDAAGVPTKETDLIPEDQDLTLEACVRIALAQNPLLQASREGLAAAHHAAKQAEAGYYPHVNLTADYRRFQTHAFLPGGLGGAMGPQTSVVGPTDDYSGGVAAQWLLLDSGRRRAHLTAARAKAGTSEYEAEIVRQDIALMVQQAYYGLLSAYEAFKVAEENAARAEDHLCLAEQRRQVGVAVEADVLRMRVETADRRLAVVRAENRVRISRGNLNTAMGLPVELPIEIDDTLPSVIAPNTVNLDASFESAIQQRPELKAALQRIVGAQSEVAAAQSDFGPVLRAMGRYGRRDSEFWPGDEDWSVGVGLELPLFTGFERSRRLDRTRRELSREEAQIRQLILTVRQEVWTSHSRLTEACEALHAADILVKDARESMRLTRQRYEVGKSTVTDLLDAQAALSRAESVLVETQWNYHIAKAAFERATGSI